MARVLSDTVDTVVSGVTLVYILSILSILYCAVDRGEHESTWKANHTFTVGVISIYAIFLVCLSVYSARGMVRKLKGVTAVGSSESDMADRRAVRAQSSPPPFD